ncbi:MAG TPA: hypothetical protein VI072_00100 [Polyangiaceae bacterium]
MNDEAAVKAEPSKRVLVAAMAALVAIPAIALVIVMNSPEAPPVDCPPTVAGAKLAQPLTAAEQAEAAARAGAFKPEKILSEPLTAADKQIVMARQLEHEDPKRARASLLRALELEPKNERALRMLASQALIDENHEEARAMGVRCIAVNPSNTWCVQVLKYAPRHVADLKAPLQRVDDCLQKEQDNLLCLAAKADLSFTAGNRADATVAVERLVALKVSLPGVRELQARLKAWSGNYAEARALFDTACAYRSEQSCFRAEVLRSQGF